MLLVEGEPGQVTEDSRAQPHGVALKHGRYSIQRDAGRRQQWAAGSVCINLIVC